MNIILLFLETDIPVVLYGWTIKITKWFTAKKALDFNQIGR